MKGEWNSKSHITTDAVSWSELHVLGFSSGRLLKERVTFDQGFQVFQYHDINNGVKHS